MDFHHLAWYKYISISLDILSRKLSLLKASSIMKHIIATTLFFAIAVFFIGCDQGVPVEPVPATNTQGHDGHDHGHDHSAAGPHDGALIGLGGEAFHLEWLHDESGKLTFFLLDDHAKSDVTTSTANITIATTLKDETVTVNIPSVDPTAAEHNQFEITDAVLLQRLEMVGHGVTAQTTVLIEDTPYTGEFEHDHGDGHSH
jgi:hypothetical protein